MVAAVMFLSRQTHLLRRLAPQKFWRRVASAASAAEVDVKSMRNVGIIAHIDAGKTTTTERMLALSGHTLSRGAAGEVDDGDTVTDFLEQERQRGITIQSAAVSILWRDHQVFLIDTPGHVDFTQEVERSVRVLDGAVLVLDAAAGVEAQTETVWRQAQKHGVRAMCFVNKMDRLGADLDASVASLRKKLGLHCGLLQMPLTMEGAQELLEPGVEFPLAEEKEALAQFVQEAKKQRGVDEEHFLGTIDLCTHTACVFPPTDASTRRDTHSILRIQLPKVLEADAPVVLQQARVRRQELVEAVADVDEATAEAYLSEAEVDGYDLLNAVSRASKAGNCVPVLCGSSLQGIGVEAVLDGMLAFLPSPEDISNAGESLSEEIIQRLADDDMSIRGRYQVPSLVRTKKGKAAIVPHTHSGLVALVFKVTHDEQRRPICFVRVYAGVLQEKVQVLVHTADGRTVKERPLHVLRPEADTFSKISRSTAGEVCAVVGFKHARTGDTLTSTHKSEPFSGAALKGIASPETVYTLEIEPETNADIDRLEEALDIMSREDPSLHWKIHEETDQFMISGMGELHLEVVCERLKRDFQIPVYMRDAYVAYREGLASDTRVSHVYQSPAAAPERICAGLELIVETRLDGGDVTKSAIDTSPSESEDGFATREVEIILDPSVDLHSEEERDALFEGLQSAVQRGILLGYPLMGLHITVEQVRRAEELQLPGTTTPGALQGAAAGAVRAALSQGEAVLLEPTMKDSVGGVLSDITGHRRGRVRNVEQRGERAYVDAEAPLATLLGYATGIRSQTRGEGTFSMEYFSHRQVDDAALPDVMKAHGRVP